MAYRTDDRARRVTLCKRKKGLYKKAEELAKLCGVDVAVVIVGDGCKPAQMVSTGHGNYSDLPSCYRVLTKYTERVTMAPLPTPAAAMDARATLVAQDNELERQRREIEDLRRQLAETDPNSQLLRLEDEELDDELSTLDEEIQATATPTPRASPSKRRCPPSQRSRSSNATATELPELTSLEVEGAIAEMAAELKREGARAESHAVVVPNMGKTIHSNNEINELMAIDDIDESFGFGKSAHTPSEAPWSGLPMVSPEEAVFGHCAMTAL